MWWTEDEINKRFKDDSKIVSLVAPLHGEALRTVYESCLSGAQVDLNNENLSMFAMARDLEVESFPPLLQKRE